MAVTLIPSFESQILEASGDVDEILQIPADPPRPFANGQAISTYFIALSDGSLIRATYEERPQFEVVVEGAGRLHIDGESNRVTVDWNIEWLNVAPNHASTAVTQKTADSLPLFRRSPVRLVESA
jgi:hypothetical protein